MSAALAQAILLLCDAVDSLPGPLGPATRNAVVEARHLATTPPEPPPPAPEPLKKGR